MGNVEIKQLQNGNYLDSVVIDNGDCDTVIGNRIEIPEKCLSETKPHINGLWNTLIKKSTMLHYHL